MKDAAMQRRGETGTVSDMLQKPAVVTPDRCALDFYFRKQIEFLLDFESVFLGFLVPGSFFHHKIWIVILMGE